MPLSGFDDEYLTALKLQDRVDHWRKLAGSTT
jgi:hypothetical protein